MKKGLMIIGGITIVVIVLFVGIFLLVSTSSEKLVCESNEGNITIMYNEETLTGYVANGLSYDLDGQKAIAEQIGVDAYIEQFKIWFSTNTTGVCK